MRNKYILLTSISIDNKYKLKRRAINDSVVNFHTKTPKKYSSRIRSYCRTREIDDNIRNDDSFLVVSISSSAHNENAAIEKAFDALDILRSMLQLQFNKGINFLARDDSTKFWSQSMVKLGEYHSLHHPNGSVAEE